MSDNQTNEANKFARKLFGAEVDAAAGAPGFKVLGSDDGTGKDEGPSKPWCELPGRGNRDLAEFAKELGAYLSESPIFRREDVIVTVEPTTGDMKIMTPERFLSWVSDHVVIFEEFEVGKGEKRKTGRQQKTMPKTTAQGVLAADRFYYQIRKLVRVNSVRMPVMSADGKPRLLPEGYDAETQIFTLKSEVAIDEAWSLEKAKLFLADIYGEFMWQEPDPGRSLSVAITLPLALFGIGLQDVEAARMGFAVRANTQGGGKSLVAQIGITPSFGLPENTAKAKEDELRKILDAAVLQGSPYLFFDNLKGHFENALIEGFMTSPVWRARVMGTQRFMRGKVCTILIVTGNNLTVSPDMQRRLLQCDIFVEEFDLQEKQHRRDLNPVVLNRPALRGEFLSALWALIRNWYEQGRPPAGTRERPFRINGFAEWSDIFGGIMQAAGYSNPLDKPKDDQSASPYTLHQRKLVELLATNITPAAPLMEYTAQELIDCCVENELFSWKIKGRAMSKEGKDWFEPTSECWSVMGLMWTKEMGGRVFGVEGGRRVKFGKKGEGRAKRYTVELLEARAAK
jgi:hypothetical protein